MAKTVPSRWLAWSKPYPAVALTLSGPSRAIVPTPIGTSLDAKSSRTLSIQARTTIDRHASGRGHLIVMAVRFAVWAESHGPVQDAIARGKALKVWKRAWKIGLMEATSPEWADRYERLA